MNRRIIRTAVMATLASAASWGWAGPKAAPPKDGANPQVSAAQVQGTVQDMQTALSVVYTAAAKAGPEAMRQSAQTLKELRQQVKEAADPTGLKSAVLGFSGTLDRIFTGTSGFSADELDSLGRSLREAQTRLEALAGPEHQAELRRRLQEAHADRALQLLRWAVERYTREHDDWPPMDPAQRLAPDYLAAVPALGLPGHKPESGIRVLRKVKDDAGLESQLKDSGGWLYVADIDSPFFGRFFIDCTHLDAQGRSWHRH